MSKTQNFESGNNKVIIQEDEVNVAGVLYYQLTYGNNSATRKMILLD